jgi:hypothetical protein
VRGESRTVQLSPEDQEKTLKLCKQMESTVNRYHGLLRQFSERAGVRIPDVRAVLSVLPDGNLRVDW